MSVVAQSNPSTIVTFPGAPDAWEQWLNVDLTFTNVEKIEPVIMIYGIMDFEEVNIVTKRPRRIHHKERPISPIRKRVNKRVEIKTNNVKTLAEFMTEKQIKLEQKSETKGNDKTQEINKVMKSKKQNEWTIVGKEQKPVSIIKLPEEQLPCNNVQTKDGTTLILKNLPKTKILNKEIQKFFSRCGSVKFVNILTNDDGTCKGSGFVKFENKVSAAKALLFNGFLYENTKVYVEYARDK